MGATTRRAQSREEVGTAVRDMKTFDRVSMLAALLGLALFTAPGCKKDKGDDDEDSKPKASCGDFTDKLVECKPNQKDLKEKIKEDCEEQLKSDTAGMVENLNCATESDCDDFEECVKDVHKKFRKERQAARIAERMTGLEKFVEDKKWKEAAQICRTFADAVEDNPVFQKLCNQTAKGATAELFIELTKMRDDLAPKDEFSKCQDLKSMAKKNSDEDALKAEELCKEVKVAGRVKKVFDAIDVAVKEGKGRVPFECEWAIKDLSKLDSEWGKKTTTKVKKACDEDLPKKLMKSGMDALKKMRDTGETKDAFSKCFDLQRLTKELGDEEKKAAKTLCEETKASKDAHEALAEAANAAKDKKDQLPFKCGWAIEKLEKVDTDWAKEMAKKVAQECFVTAGQHVLAAKVPKMKYVCDFNVKKVFQGVAKYQLKDPAIDSWIEKSKKLCDK